ncbi:MAG: hypothetical protein V1798_07695 [Pseudomonadota bacterium]
MLRTLQFLFGVILTVAAFHLSFTSCGSSNSDPTPTPTPTATWTAASTTTDYNLTLFAKVSATCPPHADPCVFNADQWGADLVTGSNVGPDGPLASNTDGFMWRPASLGLVDSSSIEFTWNSQVVVTRINLYDDPIKDSQITSGFVHFTNSKDNTLTFTDLNFYTSQAPADDGKTALALTSNTSNPVTAVRVSILTHKTPTGATLPPSLRKIEVIGHRVDEVIAEGEIRPYVSIYTVSSIFNSYDAGFNNGPNRSFKMKDDDPGSYWASTNGSNARVEWSLDRLYTITKIVLKDISTGTWTSGQLLFMDVSGDQPHAFTKAGDGTAMLTLTDTIQSQHIQVQLTGATATNSGLADISITASYTPQ